MSKTNVQENEELRAKLIAFASEWEHPYARMKSMDSPLSHQIEGIHKEMVEEMLQLIAADKPKGWMIRVQTDDGTWVSIEGEKNVKEFLAANKRKAKIEGEDRILNNLKKLLKYANKTVYKETIETFIVAELQSRENGDVNQTPSNVTSEDKQ